MKSLTTASPFFKYQGFMVLANLRPEYQNKVHLANFLAPVAYVEHMKSPIRYLAPFIGSVEVSYHCIRFLFSSISAKQKSVTFIFQWISDYLGGGEFLPSNEILDVIADWLCDDNFFQVFALP